jgi:hypothetical protein
MVGWLTKVECGHRESLSGRLPSRDCGRGAVRTAGRFVLPPGEPSSLSIGESVNAATRSLESILRRPSEGCRARCIRTSAVQAGTMRSDDLHSARLQNATAQNCSEKRGARLCLQRASTRMGGGPAIARSRGRFACAQCRQAYEPCRNDPSQRARSTTAMARRMDTSWGSRR